METLALGMLIGGLVVAWALWTHQRIVRLERASPPDGRRASAAAGLLVEDSLDVERGVVRPRGVSASHRVSSGRGSVDQEAAESAVWEAESAIDVARAHDVVEARGVETPEVPEAEDLVEDVGRRSSHDAECDDWARASFEDAAIGMGVVDRDGRWVRVNRSLSRTLGASAGRLVGRRLLAACHPEDVEPAEKSLRQVTSGEVAHCQVEHRVDARDGVTQWVLTTISGGGSEAAPASRLTVQMQDITERKRFQAGLREAKEAAESANRAKTEFLAKVTHEIRTPIHAVLGMLDLALASDLDAEQRRYLDVARTSSHSLLAIVNDLLDFSKVEAGSLDICPIEFRLRSCVDSIIASFAHQAEEKGVELAGKVGADTPDALIGDPGRLRQVLVNLIGNALRFTEEGSVAVDVCMDGYVDGDVRLRFVVRDTGMGIDPEQHARIFEPFRQVDGSATRRFGGTGLGLSICRQLVDLMGGDIGLDSAPGRGSSFWFTARFRLHPPTSGRAQSERDEGSETNGARALVIDGDEECGVRTAEVLERLGIDVDRVEESAAARARCIDARSSGETYDLVIVDAGRDGTEGFDTVEALREGGDGAAIILTTSAGVRGDARRCRDLGVAAYLVKPFDASELRSACESALRRPEVIDGSMPVTRHSIREEAQSKRVLVAEDNALCQELARCLLEKWGHWVVIVENGVQALEALERGAFDIVLMDMQMPICDGVTAIRRIRAHADTRVRETPVLAMTANALAEDMEACLGAGADDFVSKPVAPDVLQEKVRRLAVRRLARSPAPVDPVVLRRVFGSQIEELAPRLSQVVLGQQPEQLRELRGAHERGDVAEVRRLAHSLKGSLAQFGANEARGLAQELEELAAEGGSDRSAELVEALERATAEFREFLARPDWLESVLHTTAG